MKEMKWQWVGHTLRKDMGNTRYASMFKKLGGKLAMMAQNNLKRPDFSLSVIEWGPKFKAAQDQNQQEENHGGLMIAWHKKRYMVKPECEGYFREITNSWYLSGTWYIRSKLKAVVSWRHILKFQKKKKTDKLRWLTGNIVLLNWKHHGLQ